jgi:hypothetical protein
MAIRSFRYSDGTTWTVWRVSSTVQNVPGAPAEWLAFQNEASTERRRLFEVPPHWDELPDSELERLLRLAEPARAWSKLSPPGGMPAIERDAGKES